MLCESASNYLPWKLNKVGRMDIFMTQVSEWAELVAQALYLIGQVGLVEIALLF